MSFRVTRLAGRVAARAGMPSLTPSLASHTTAAAGGAGAGVAGVGVAGSAAWLPAAAAAARCMSAAAAGTGARGSSHSSSSGSSGSGATGTASAGATAAAAAAAAGAAVAAAAMVVGTPSTAEAAWWWPSATPAASSTPSSPSSSSTPSVQSGRKRSDTAAPRDANPLALETEWDVVVVGGGIVGCAIAREVLRRFPDKRVAVLEKESEVAGHQTGHNSGVIHAGIYYEPGSVMAATCVRGAELMYAFCDAAGVPYSRAGKLIVATSAAEDAVVEALVARARANGVPGVELLSGEQVRAREPAVVATSALWSPNTGIADYGAVTRALAEEVTGSGRGDVKVQWEVRGARRLADGRVELAGGEKGQGGPAKTVTARHVITAGGLQADRVARLFGGAVEPRVVAFRGTYYQMKPEHAGIVHTNVYPVPSGGGIPVGVHFTPTVNERRSHATIVGPGACIAFAREGYRTTALSALDVAEYVLNGALWRFVAANPRLTVEELRKDFDKAAFMRDAQKLVPSVTPDMVDASFTGVMAQVFQRDGTAAKDYILERKALGGTTLCVRSAPSPAATASLAVAEHIVNVAAEDFGWK